MLQKILDEIAEQVDEYESKYGCVDRSEFDGEFFVPPELRNRANSINSRSLRIHGGLLTISRSRTFLSLSTNNRASIHNSTPDLSRSVPNTPNSNHKLTLTSSYDSVLEEENEDVGGGCSRGINGKNHKKMIHTPVQHIFESGNNVPLRRKSEDLLAENRSVSSKLAQKQQMIPRIKNIPNPKPVFDESNRESTSSSSSVSLNSQTSVKNQVGWGNFRGSNSFQADLNINSFSTYTIPRVTLNHQKVQVNESTTASIQRSIVNPRKSLPENSRVSTFLSKKP